MEIIIVDGSGFVEPKGKHCIIDIRWDPIDFSIFHNGNIEKNGEIDSSVIDECILDKDMLQAELWDFSNSEINEIFLCLNKNKEKFI